MGNGFGMVQLLFYITSCFASFESLMKEEDTLQLRKESKRLAPDRVFQLSSSTRCLSTKPDSGIVLILRTLALVDPLSPWVSIPFPQNLILFLLLLLIQGNSYLLVEKLSYPSYYYPFDLSFRRPFMFHTFLWFHPVKERIRLSFLLPRRTSLLLHPLQSQLTQQPYRRATLSPNPNFEEKQLLSPF